MPLLRTVDINPRWSHARGGASLTPTASAGNFTVGVTFHVELPGISCIGCRFYAVASAAKTIKAKLYNAAGTLLDTQSLAISANGVYEVAWGVNALTPFALYRVCTWQTDGLNYTTYPIANANAPGRPFPAGGAVVYNSIQQFLGGDTAPTNLASGETYPVEPILSGLF